MNSVNNPNHPRHKLAKKTYSALYHSTIDTYPISNLMYLFFHLRFSLLIDLINTKTIELTYLIPLINYSH